MKTQEFNFQHFKASGQNFHRSLVSELNSRGLSVNQLESDHLCFRVSTTNEYAYYKENLLSHGELLTEASVNGRPICTFALHHPFQTESHKIRLVELPAPRQGTLYTTGFEHAEFVVQECFDSFAAKVPGLVFTKSGSKTINPELCLDLGGMQAKFHHHSLARIIEIEKAEIQDIIFDFDGTLIKSRENIYEINRIVFSEALGREVSRQESIEKFHPEFSKLFEAFALTCPTKQSQAVAGWGSVSEQFGYELFEGVVDLLTSLKNQGFRLHLWTARDERSARKILRDHNIEHFFITLSFATAVDSKPHANSLSFAWDSAQANKVIVIGDSPSDIIGSKNIRAFGGAALWDTHAKWSSLVAAGAELCFHQLSDLKEWICKKSEGVA